MSWQAVKYVMEHSTATNTDRLVLLAIAEAADAKKWETFIGHETIGKRAGGKDHPKADSDVRRSIRKLARMGELEVILHGAPQLDRRFQHRSNRYRVVRQDTADIAKGVTDDHTGDLSSGVTDDHTGQVLGGSNRASVDSGVRGNMTPYPSVKTYPSSSSGEEPAPKIDDDEFLTEVRKVIAANRWEISNRAGKIADRGGRYGWINRTAANLHAETEVTEMAQKLHAEFPDWSPKQVGDEVEPVEDPAPEKPQGRTYGPCDEDPRFWKWTDTGQRWTPEDYAAAKASPKWRPEFDHDPYEDESYGQIIQIAGVS